MLSDDASLDRLQGSSDSSQHRSPGVLKTCPDQALNPSCLVRCSSPDEMLSPPADTWCDVFLLQLEELNKACEEFAACFTEPPGRDSGFGTSENTKAPEDTFDDIPEVQVPDFVTQALSDQIASSDPERLVIDEHGMAVWKCPLDQTNVFAL